MSTPSLFWVQVKVKNSSKISWFPDSSHFIQGLGFDFPRRVNRDGAGSGKQSSKAPAKFLFELQGLKKKFLEAGVD